MKAFWFRNPTKIVFGAGRADEIGELIRPVGRKVLLVHGKRSAVDTGLRDRVVRSLKSAGLEVVEHGGVRSNPIVSHVREGVRLARTHGVDSVLGVGGGSVIDAAKSIAFGATVRQDVWEIYEQKGQPQSALPIFSIVTIAATGSEMNAAAALSNEETGEKLAIGSPSLVPVASILDPEVTTTVPRNYTVYGLVDAVSHVLEPYFNGEQPFAPVQDRLAEGTVLGLMDTAQTLLADLGNVDARANALWGACMAHNMLANLGRGKVVFEIHCLAHALGALLDVPHGAAISVAIPAWMTFREREKRERLARFAERIWNASVHESEGARARSAIQRTFEWLLSIGSPVSLKDLGVSRQQEPALVDYLTVSVNEGGMRDVSREGVEEIVRLMREPEISSQVLGRRGLHLGPSQSTWI